MKLSSSANQNGTNRLWLDLVQNQVDSLRFGIVQIVVHDSRVVQIERTEKVRLEGLNSASALNFKAHQAAGGVSSNPQ